MNNIPPEILAEIKKLAQSFPEIKEVYLYGSRARGDHHPTSDIDLAVITDGSNPNIRTDFYLALEERIVTALKFDVLDPSSTDNLALLANVDRDKVQIYSTN